MVALAIALPPPSVHEIRLETDMFVTRINFNFTIAHCEPKWVQIKAKDALGKNRELKQYFGTFLYIRVTELLDYSADELVGRNIYNLCHAEDADKLKKSHLDRE